MKTKKILALLLVLCMVVAMVSACGGSDEATESADGETSKTESNKDLKVPTFEDNDVYLDALGEFYNLYDAACQQKDQDVKFAMMAIAEAKLLESGVMLPTSSQGGNFAISAAVANTISSVLWGQDSYRLHNVLVVTEPIKKADRAEIKALWNELKGTGTYMTEVKKLIADKGYTLKDTYNTGYSTDPNTWDVLATSQTADSEPVVNTYDGLMEYDSENVLQYAMAEKLEVSEDGKTYTFTIRKGVKWVDSQGRVVGEVKADDWVAAMQHMMDAAEGLEYLIDGVIVNASEYMAGEVGMEEVGVKAVDDYTLVYTLTDEVPYFITMLGYGVFAPMCRSFYESKGGKFGGDYDPTADTYTYGDTKDDIAYNGPYLITNATKENTIVFTANDKYWNKDAVNVKTITWKYNDGKDALKAYNDRKAGELDGCGLNSEALAKAKEEGLFETYAYVSATDATCYSMFINVNRVAYANCNDDTKVVSPKTETEKAVAKYALRNAHLRRALCMAIDRASYNAQSVGEELKLNSIQNEYTPGAFVMLSKEVTVKINDKDVTFKAGTNYGEIVQAQIDADGIKIKVYDKENETSSGFDGWYNPEAAVEELNIAIEELKAQGIEISKENPLVVDMPKFVASKVYTGRAESIKASIEASLGGLVKVNLVDANTQEEMLYAGYFTSGGTDSNYDFYDFSGWGPDYGDPKTYLDTFLPDGAGYMTKSIGLY